MVSSTSERLTPFLAAHEGFVSRAYKCPAGVVTIGYGMTGRSKVFADYWKAKTGHALRMGDSISRAEADAVLTKMLAVEYSPPVVRAAPNATQHAFDGATSVSFNCRPGALKWKWAAALGRGEVTKAAALLRKTAVTATVLPTNYVLADEIGTSASLSCGIGAASRLLSGSTDDPSAWTVSTSGAWVAQTVTIKPS